MRGLSEIKSIRLRGWDYGRNATYFITICTKSKKHYFGEIPNRVMHLSEIGVIAQSRWQEIPQHFPFVNLGVYIIMPDHFHGILVIDKPMRMVETDNVCDNVCDNVACNIPTNKPPKTTTNDHMSSISPKPGSLPTIIRSYKSAVTKHAHLINAEFAWQSRFYDHIIRNPDSADRIQHYIRNNVEAWAESKYDPVSLRTRYRSLTMIRHSRK